MRLLACVVLDGNPPDEVILDLMDLVNDVNLMLYDVVGYMMLSVVLDDNPIDRVLSLNGNPLDEEDGNLLDEVVLDELVK